MTSETAPIVAPDMISDRDLVLQFESLGDNCEFGLVQRRAGAEPLGLLRFSSAPIRPLLDALHNRFEGLSDPAHVRLWAAKGEYLITLEKYDFVYHTDVKVGEMDPEALHRQQARILPFLVTKMIADLENPEKILVFRQNELLAANDLLDLRAAIAAYGPATLLWVQQTRPGHPPGRVEQIADHLMVGYVRRLADRETVPDLDLSSWLLTLRRAYAMWRALPANAASEPAKESTPPASVELIFGRDGNASGYTQYGWSPAEDHHTFAIDNHSLVTLPAPAEAPAYRLELDIAPYLAPPALTAQRLEVIVNGELVRTFDPVEPGVTVCSVPGRLVHGHDRVDIVLTHPRATRPLDVDQGTDTRRLAIMFRRLKLTGTGATPEPAPASLEPLFGPNVRPDVQSPSRPDLTWAFEDRSLLMLPRPPDAANYRLELDIRWPGEPEALAIESLEVMVNGMLVHTFFPVTPGPLSCLVSGRLIQGRDEVEILLIHPGGGEGRVSHGPRPPVPRFDGVRLVAVAE